LHSWSAKTCTTTPTPPSLPICFALPWSMAYMRRLALFANVFYFLKKLDESNFDILGMFHLETINMKHHKLQEKKKNYDKHTSPTTWDFI
jgi:hypothetical protein